MRKEGRFHSEAYPAGKKPDIKAVFHALSDLGSADGVDPDWRAEVLEKASPKDIQRINNAFLEGRTEADIASMLNLS